MNDYAISTYNQSTLNILRWKQLLDQDSKCVQIRRYFKYELAWEIVFTIGVVAIGGIPVSLFSNINNLSYI